MKHLFKVIFVLSSLLLFHSCCADVSKEKIDTSYNKRINNSPAFVAINQSNVKAKIEEILLSPEGNFAIKAFITEVNENPAYPSLALAGNSYLLIPNFVLGEDKTIEPNEEKNIKLIQLSKRKHGDTFEAIISYENLKGWFIQEVISD